MIITILLTDLYRPSFFNGVWAGPTQSQVKVSPAWRSVKVWRDNFERCPRSLWWGRKKFSLGSRIAEKVPSVSVSNHQFRRVRSFVFLGVHTSWWIRRWVWSNSTPLDLTMIAWQSQESTWIHEFFFNTNLGYLVWNMFIEVSPRNLGEDDSHFAEQYVFR